MAKSRLKTIKCQKTHDLAFRKLQYRYVIDRFPCRTLYIRIHCIYKLNIYRYSIFLSLHVFLKNNFRSHIQRPVRVRLLGIIRYLVICKLYIRGYSQRSECVNIATINIQEHTLANINGLQQYPWIFLFLDSHCSVFSHLHRLQRISEFCKHNFAIFCDLLYSKALFLALTKTTQNMFELLQKAFNGFTVSVLDQLKRERRFRQ